MDKLTIQNIIDAFAAETGVTKKIADGFGRTFFEVIVEGLKEDGLVKINGLGTFKVVSVADRESVNVNNGERIVIEGYKKVTFTPADSVSDVSEVTATIQKKVKKAAAKKTKPAPKEEVKEETIVEQPNQFGGIDSVISTPESVKVAKNAVKEEVVQVAERVESVVAQAAEKIETVVAPIAEKVEPSKEEDKPVETQNAVETPKPAKTGKGGVLLKWLLILVAVAICVLLAVKFCCGSQEKVTEPAGPVEPVKPAEPAEEQPVAEQPKDTVEYKTYVMQSGDFLAKISRDFYGTKDSVASIIRLNKITNPDSIEVGAVLLMP